MGDLQELFNRLKAQPFDAPAPSQSSANQSSIWNESQQQLYQHPSVSSPIISPPSHTPNPVHSSNVISPVNPSSAAGTPAPDQNRTNNLLNLLKFNNQGSQAGPMANLQNVGGLRSSSFGASGDGNEASHPRPVSAQDLMASFQRKSSSQNVGTSSMTAAGAEKPETVSRPMSDSKDFLLNLLNKPKETKPATADETDAAKSADAKDDEHAVGTLSQSMAATSIKSTAEAEPQSARSSTPVREFGVPSSENTPFEAKASWSTFVNPFDQLRSSWNPATSSRPTSSAEPNKFTILQQDPDVEAALNGEASLPAAKQRKLASAEQSPAPSPLPAEPEKGKSVSAKLEGVGEKVDKEVANALAQADAHDKKQTTPRKLMTPPTGDNTADDATPIKKEPAGDGDAVEESWESAESDTTQKAEDLKVEVYNFPMKPFVSIHIKTAKTPRPIRQINFTGIAVLKKEFDQIDRCLVTASQTHIVYAQVATKKDNAGFRVLRQDTGTNKPVFRSSGERIFNVQLCTSAVPANDIETVIGTGVNGTVFWTSLAKSRGELFADDDLEAQGFILPLLPTQEEQASGTQVKTRSKTSSRHPQYFGVSRGKLIHIIAPETVKNKVYTNAKTRKVNSEKYLAEHGLRIMTGKACKDFCFSEDDTVIVSLDKSGRFKFWDIRDLTSRASDITEGKHEAVELREPVWDLNAASSGSKPDEKPSVSSIMFLDKERPMTKGIALRYMLIGFKQNHILQLWDLGLGKAVQEIRLPHEKDSDGICSLNYHAKSGIITIAHPTRNSIYFIHLSAPRYNLPHMEQAKYINLLARNDAALPRPESTAIMSGLREFSFNQVGQLRSLDMLAQPVENGDDPNSEDATLFELYIMHSKGAMGMNIKRRDLGWDRDSKMMNPVDAIEAGVIEVKELLQPPKLPPSSEQSSNADSSTSRQTGKPASVKKHEPAKGSTSSAGKADSVKEEPASSPKKIASPATIRSEASSKQGPETPSASQSTPTIPPSSTPESYSMAAQRAISPEAKSIKKPGHLSKELPSSPEVGNSDALQPLLNKHFESLYQRIDADKRVQDAAGSAKQDAMLRLVSSTLTENVEKSLSRIVSENMTKEVVPSITNDVNKTVEKKLSEALPQQLSTHVAKEVKAALPQAVQHALKDTQIHTAIATQVAQKIQHQVTQLLQQSLPSLVTQATQKSLSELETRAKAQEVQRQQDSAKIDELHALVEGLSKIIHDMSTGQVAFQEQILKMQRPGSRSAASGRDVAASSSSEAAVETVPEPPKKTAEEEEAERITQLLVKGEYDAATIAWLQSPNQATLFDRVFVRVNPRYLSQVTPLVALSVSAAVTASLETHINARLEWLAAVLEIIDINDADIKEVAPRIMDVLAQRLQGAYMRVSETEPAEPAALKRISGLCRRVGEVRRLAG